MPSPSIAMKEEPAVNAVPVASFRVPPESVCNLKWVIAVLSRTLRLTLMVVVASSWIEAGRVMDGWSAASLMVIVKVPVASLSPPLSVPPVSVSVTVTDVLPYLFAAGVNARVPLAFIVGIASKSDESNPLSANVESCPLSSAGPSLILEAQVAEYAPESSSTVTSLPLVKPGASLTAVTVMVSVASLLQPLSCAPTHAWKPIVMLPLKSATGV